MPLLELPHLGYEREKNESAQQKYILKKIVDPFSKILESEKI